MEPIRILQENVIMDPGGIESLLMNLYRHIDRDVIQFDFMLHRSDKGTYDDEIKEMGGKIYITEPFNPFHHGKYMSSMRKVMSDHPEYKIIHAHSELNYWPLKVAKQLGIPVRISHSHNAKSTINLKYLFLCYEKAFIKDVATDWFMCSSLAGEWTYGKKAVTEGKCIFLKNGIETQKYAYNRTIREEKRKELGITDNFVIGHIGRFMQQKNHAFLIDIFSTVKKMNPKAKLLLVSEGRLMDEIKQKVSSLGLQNDVLFLGFRNDINELMQAMDVFVLPSLWEGLPFTLVEAQAAGLPCVISDVISDESIVTDLIKKESLKQSAEIWAKKILNVYDETTRKDTAYLVKDAGFDIETSAQWLQEFYLKRYWDETRKNR